MVSAGCARQDIKAAMVGYEDCAPEPRRARLAAGHDAGLSRRSHTQAAQTGSSELRIEMTLGRTWRSAFTSRLVL